MQPPYKISDADADKIDKAFTYHAPKTEQPFDQPYRYNKLRAEAKELAIHMTQCCPPSRELSLAFTNLEQAIFWANASIARNE